MTTTTAAIKQGDRVRSTVSASGYLGSTGTVQHVLATGRVHVAWDDDTNCSVGASEIAPLAPADDRVLAAHVAMFAKAFA